MFVHGLAKHWGELGMNLTDKSPALVKISVFLTGEKMNFFFLTPIFPNMCSVHQPKEA